MRVAAWAQARGHQFKRVRDGDGFVDRRPASTARRGGSSGARRSAPTSQGHELRLRMELGLPPDLQMLLIDRSR